MIKNLLSYLKEYKIFALLTPIFLVIEVMMEVFIPSLMSKVLDQGVPNGDIDFVMSIGVRMIIMAVIGVLAGAIGARLTAIAGTGLTKNLREAMFEKVQEFSFSNIEKFGTASLLTRITTDAVNTQNAFITTLRISARSPLMLISALIMSLRINTKLTMTFALVIPAIVIVFFLVTKFAMPRFQEMLYEYDNLNEATQENLSGIRVVKSFVREDFETEKFATISDRVLKAQVKAENILIFAMPMMQLIMYSCLIIIYWNGGRMAVVGDIGIGQFLSLFTYITQILMSLIMIATTFVQIVVSRASMVRISEVLDEKVSITDGPDGLEHVKDGSIEFINVDFRYTGPGEQKALTDVNLSIASGETIGIIGSTGSAKSTLVQLIPRLYDVTRGCVRVGGVDVRDYKLAPLREQVAMVLQQNILFTGTIRDNLKWGNKDATDEDLDRVTKIASAHDFIMSFPDGYDTWLDRGGVNLSGGQKQRLCIARALLKDPKVIILDDSTSAVDTATDASIRKALKENVSETTAIIIAQRISSVMDADRIIVMDSGKIDAVGSHEQLMESNEIYRDIYISQQRGVA